MFLILSTYYIYTTSFFKLSQVKLFEHVLDIWYLLHVHQIIFQLLIRMSVIQTHFTRCDLQNDEYF